MNRRNFSKQPWYTYAVAACIAVAFYFLLSNIGVFHRFLVALWQFVSPVMAGAVIAYLMNPLVKFYHRTVFRKIKVQKLGYALSITLAVVTVLIVVGVLLGTLVPQLISSVGTLIGNMNGYIESLEEFLQRFEVIQKFIKVEEVLTTIASSLTDNLGRIINSFGEAGKGVFNIVIAFILAIYFLAEKDMLRSGIKRLMRAILKENRFNAVTQFLQHCDAILLRYIGGILLDALIVSVINMIFMLATGMSYAGLVSFVVGVTNMIPTFGPMIGAVIGAFILLLVKPSYALWFLIFTFLLQTCDGYIIKPKLFGGSLGVSGLWILIAIILGGRLFGVAGVLLAIPFAAIFTEIYKSYVLPFLERQREKKEAVSEEEKKEE